jgi:Tfp pilus assembly protein PilF
MARLVSILLLIMTLATPQIEARVLSGSRTERKMNRKIERLLKSARKQYDSGKVQESLDTYWKILEIDPQETFAYLELGEIYFDLRIYNRAIELLEPGTKAAEAEMDNETICHYYCVLTNAYVKSNKMGLASKALIKAAQASPKNPLPRKILGDIYLANNRIKSAYKAYKKALSFDPNYQPALEKIGELTTRYKIELSEPQSSKTAVKPAKTRKAPVERATPRASEKSPPPKVVKKDDDEGAESVEEAMEDRPMPMPSAAAKTKEPLQTKPVSISAKPPVADATNIAEPVIALPGQQPAKTTTAQNQPQASQEEIDNQLDKLLAGSIEEKKIATAFFVKLERKGLIEIEELLFDSDPEVRIIAVRTLSAFTGFKDRVKNILHDAIDDPDPEVQKEIQAALKSML